MKNYFINCKLLFTTVCLSLIFISCEKEETEVSTYNAKIPEVIYTVTIQGNNGMYVSSENGQKPMHCNRSVADAWETFQLIRTNANGYILKGNNGMYVRVDESEGSNYYPDSAPLYCDATREDAMTFWIGRYPKPNGKYTILKYKVGRFLSSENGQGPMNLNRSESDSWEEFTISGFNPQDN